jgi:SAM-dependent methyltransferase
LSRDAFARLQADEHPLLDLPPGASLSEIGLHLVHLKAYDSALLLAEGKDVLDLGCNTGYGTIRLASSARRLVGADVSPAAIDRARAAFGAKAEWVLFDGAGLPFPDASFDLVTGFQLIEHIPEPAPFLAEIARVLRPDGRAVLTTPNAAIRLDPGMRPWNRFHAYEYRASELATLLDDRFRSVAVHGLFAIPTLYGAELKRVGAALRRARAARLIRTVLGEASLQALMRLRSSWLRRFRRARSAGPPSGEASGAPASQYSTDDLFYSDNDLDLALDLMAVCSQPRPGTAP